MYYAVPRAAICIKEKDVNVTYNNQIIHSNVFVVLRRICLTFIIQGIFRLSVAQSVKGE